MDFYSFKKVEGVVTKRYGLKVGVKTECNVIVWYHISLYIWKKN